MAHSDVKNKVRKILPCIIKKPENSILLISWQFGFQIFITLYSFSTYLNTYLLYSKANKNSLTVRGILLWPSSSTLMDGHKQQQLTMFTSSFIKLFDKWKKDCCGWNMNCWTSISNMSIETNGRSFALRHFKERIVHSLQTNQTLFSSSFLWFMSAQIPKNKV